MHFALARDTGGPLCPPRCPVQHRAPRLSRRSTHGNGPPGPMMQEGQKGSVLATRKHRATTVEPPPCRAHIRRNAALDRSPQSGRLYLVQLRFNDVLERDGYLPVHRADGEAELVAACIELQQAPDAYALAIGHGARAEGARRGNLAEVIASVAAQPRSMRERERESEWVSPCVRRLWLSSRKNKTKQKTGRAR